MLTKKVRTKRGCLPREVIVSSNKQTDLAKVFAPSKRYTKHISDMTNETLRTKLRDNQVNPDAMTNMEVRMECMIRYGYWYEVNV